MRRRVQRADARRRPCRRAPRLAVACHRLTNLYNSLAAGSPKRLAVYRAVVQVASRAGRVSLLVPQLEKLEQWLAEWKATPQEGRALLLELSDALRKAQLLCVPRALPAPHAANRSWRSLTVWSAPMLAVCLTDSNEAHGLLRKYLASLEKEAAAATGSDAQAAATRAVVEAINTPAVLHFDELLALAGACCGATALGGGGGGAHATARRR